jgi:hypothetical protein
MEETLSIDGSRAKAQRCLGGAGSTPQLKE